MVRQRHIALITGSSPSKYWDDIIDAVGGLDSFVGSMDSTHDLQPALAWHNSVWSDIAAASPGETVDRLVGNYAAVQVRGWGLVARLGLGCKGERLVIPSHVPGTIFTPSYCRPHAGRCCRCCWSAKPTWPLCSCRTLPRACSCGRQRKRCGWHLLPGSRRACWLPRPIWPSHWQWCVAAGIVLLPECASCS